MSIKYSNPVDMSENGKHKEFTATLSNGKALRIQYSFYSLTQRWEYLIRFTEKVYYRSWENSEAKMIKEAKKAIESMESLFKD